MFYSPLMLCCCCCCCSTLMQPIIRAAGLDAMRRRESGWKLSSRRWGIRERRCRGGDRERQRERDRKDGMYRDEKARNEGRERMGVGKNRVTGLFARFSGLGGRIFGLTVNDGVLISNEGVHLMACSGIVIR